MLGPVRDRYLCVAHVGRTDPEPRTRAQRPRRADERSRCRRGVLAIAVHRFVREGANARDAHVDDVELVAATDVRAQRRALNDCSRNIEALLAYAPSARFVSRRFAFWCYHVRISHPAETHKWGARAPLGRDFVVSPGVRLPFRSALPRFAGRRRRIPWLTNFVRRCALENRHQRMQQKLGTAVGWRNDD